MLELTVRHADAWNLASWSVPPTRIPQECARLVDLCQRIGRDPATLDLTANVMVHLLASGQQTSADDDVIVGSAEEVAVAVRGFAEVGVKHLVISVSPGGLAGVERFGRVLELLAKG
jgi:alkanesulfonate monooxygenase SsuD/methylene tetrahydromethanopterin reductase-like flavin-dependent oxidoreductase (luciferase family)